MNLNDIRSMDKENILKSIGLQPYQSAAWTAIPGIALFGIGVLVGAGVGMLFAPKSGQELRDDISERVASLKNRAQTNTTGLDDVATQG